MSQIQTAFDLVRKYLAQEDQELRECFEGLTAKEVKKEMVDLVRCGMEWRRMKMDESLEGERRRERQVDLTPKITEVRQNVAHPLKIYGKPKVKLNNQNDCVVHCLDHSQSQQSLRGKAQLPNKAQQNNQLVLGHSKQKISFGIKQVLSTRIEPTSQPNQRKVGRINTRKEGTEGSREMTEAINKQNQQILELQKENRRLLQKMQQMTHKEGTSQLKSTKKLKKEKQEQQGCCCCSSDQEVLAKLEKMYTDMQRSNQKRKGPKTYKITTNANYPMTSSQESLQ